jgi:hypothetical protein
MNIGELFFSLGFKSEGVGEAKNFESSLSGVQDVTIALTEAMNALTEMVGQIAIKMGVLTQKELNEIKIKEKIKKNVKDINTAEKQGNIERTKGAGILTVVNQKMQDYWGKLGAARIQLLASTSALTYFVKKASDAAVQIDKISSLTGLSSGSIQRLGDMAAQTGGSIEDITGAVQHFQKNSVDIMLGRGGNIGAFQFMGIDPHQDPLKILDQLSVKLKTMPTALGTNMARDMGLSDDLIYLLKNRENIKPASDETFLTDKEIKRLKDFNFYFNRIFEQNKRALQKFASFLTPVATHVVYFFDRMSQMFFDVTKKMEPFFGLLNKYMPVIVAMGTALFIAMFPVQAVLALLALAIEDLWSFMKGDDSVLGRMVKYFQDMDNYVESLISGLKTMISIFTGGAFDKALGGMLPGIGDKTNDFIQSMWDKIKSGVSSPLGPVQGFNPGKSGDQTSNNVIINVNESTTPKETAVAVKEAFDRTIQGAYWEGQAYG